MGKDDYCFHCGQGSGQLPRSTEYLVSCRDRLQHTKTKMSNPIVFRDQDMLILMIGTFKNCGKRKKYASE